jgi:hypothetical protein
MRSLLHTLPVIALLSPPAHGAAAPPVAVPPEPGAPEGMVRRLGTTRFRHDREVRALAFSRDGRVIASGGRTT